MKEAWTWVHRKIKHSRKKSGFLEGVADGAFGLWIFSAVIGCTWENIECIIVKRA